MRIQQSLSRACRENNTYRLNLEETKAKIAALEYIQKEMSGEGNFVQ